MPLQIITTAGSEPTQPVSQSTSPWVVAGEGTAGTAATGVVTVQGIASMTKLLVTPDANSSVNVAQVGGTTVVTGGTNGTWGVGGTQGNNVAITANPVLIGAEAQQSQGTTNATAGRVIRPIADRNGRLIVIKPKLTLASANGTPISTATSTQLVAAPSSGNHLKIYRIHASNAGATSTKVAWREHSSTLYFETQLPQNGVVSLELEGEWELATAMALDLNTDAAGSIYWTVTYETIPD